MLSLQVVKPMDIPMPQANPNSSKRGGCLFILLTILGLFQILFALRVLEDSAIYGELSIAPVFHVGSSLIWLVIIIWAAYAVFRKQSQELGISTIIAYLVFRLMQGIFFAQADYDRNRIPFLLLVMVSLLLIPLLRWLLRGGTHTQRG
jgi:hypothetical protein